MLAAASPVGVPPKFKRGVEAPCHDRERSPRGTRRDASLPDALEKWYHLSRIVRLLSAPEDVVYLQVVGRELQKVRGRHTLPRFGVYLFQVAVLDGDADGNDPGGLPDQRVGTLQLPRPVRHQDGA